MYHFTCTAPKPSGSTCKTVHMHCIAFLKSKKKISEIHMNLMVCGKDCSFGIPIIQV